MQYLWLTEPEKSTYKICFLVPSIRKDEIVKAYITPYGLNPEEILVLSLHYNQTSKKTLKKEMQQYITEELLPVFVDADVNYIVVCDGDYFKALTNATYVERNLGYVLDSVLGKQKVIYVPSYSNIFYNPEGTNKKIEQGILALKDHMVGTYKVPGNDLITFSKHPTTVEEIAWWLDHLVDINWPLTVDIESFSLKHHSAGIGTISFAWFDNEGISFAVDYREGEVDGVRVGYQERNEPVRALLRSFFERFQEKTIYHHIAYDVYVLIYQLYMEDILDTKGLLHGLKVMLKNWDCTRLIAYLATNTCAGNKLSLKDLAQSFAGNYAMDTIDDITKIPLVTLLKYNLVDALSTWHVHDKYYDVMVADQQLNIYETIFKPATVDIIQMQLTGMPINMKQVIRVKQELGQDHQTALLSLQNSDIIQEFTQRLNQQWVDKKNITLKKKRVTLADSKLEFNPNSSPQLQDLLYEMLGLPIIAHTDSKKPSTKAKVLKALESHTTDHRIITLLGSLQDHAAVAILLETFIPAMENAVQGPDDWHYLFGYFNLGGTLSGRLSSSNPNLQNLPTGAEGEDTIKGHYGKLIKSCFEAPPGWIFAGLDFNGLEDKISGLTTKDPNKLKCYVDGFDGHSLRAYAYFGDRMPDIIDTVESINSIQKKYKSLRQESKAPTFALTYQGTFSTLMTNCGFSTEKALIVEAKYKELYKVSIDWVADKLKEACNTGYVTVAFGLRVRTPLLKQVILGNRRTPHEAEAEGRSAGNALGQSWCLLNSRAASEFMNKVRESDFQLDIRPCAQIHDAQYYLLRDDIQTVSYTNEHLIKAVKWQDHPEIYHDQVKLSGDLSIFWPTWAEEITIQNEDSSAQIEELIVTTIRKNSS